MRVISFSTTAALALSVSTAMADRLAVVPLESPGHAPPASEAEKLSADLTARGHRMVATADALSRVSAGNGGAGPDWATQVVQAIATARAALTRLDRSLAASMAARIRDDLVVRGGGAGGAGVLVEWCLLERQLAITASNANAASRWLDAAVAFGPDAELDAMNHPDDERNLFAQRRATLKSEVPAELSFSTAPATADVWVDGVKRCESPCTVTLLAGRHFARLSSPAYTPATVDFELAPGAKTSRRITLTAAYSGASTQAIASMLADPNRRSEGASALEPMARFLDVDHVVALVPEGNGFRVLLAPVPSGAPRLGTAVPSPDLAPTVTDQLRSAAQDQGGTSLFKKPGTWIVGAGIVAAIVGGFLIYQSTRSPESTGSITVQ